MTPAALANSLPPLQAANDATTYYNAGWFVLFIGSKEFLVEAPLGKFPPKVRIDVQSSLAADGPLAVPTQLSVIRAQPGGRPYFVQPQITIPSGQNFSVTVNFPGLVPLPSGFNARVGCELYGFLYRNSQ